MDETKTKYSFIPNPGLRQPHDLPPTPKMKIAILEGCGRGTWPEEYKHLDTGKPLIQELVDLEIQKFLGDDAWLDYSREAARRQYLIQPKKEGRQREKAHSLPGDEEREIDVSVFLDVASEFGYKKRDALKFWSLHSIAHVKKKEGRLGWLLKRQSSLEAAHKYRLASQEKQDANLKKKIRDRSASKPSSEAPEKKQKKDSKDDQEAAGCSGNKDTEMSYQAATLTLMEPGGPEKPVNSQTCELGVSIGVVVDSEDSNP